MSNKEYTKEELSNALENFGIKNYTDVSRYGSGHINDTFKVETAGGERFILQRVTDFFDKEILRENILRVTSHLKAKGVKTLDVVGYENPWRVYKFLEGYTSVDLITDPSQAELAAGAFAAFQNDLADLPAPPLKAVIPHFHDTVDRLRLLDEAAAADVKGRKASVAAELAFVDARREEASKIVNM
ncbi:MAG: phosphotransferase, partial [Kiritimatiellae bacterium]|nr:phosphotransferase [Kiritimatiellia bacterium]